MRSSLLVLVSGCVAPSFSDAYLVLDARARSAGVQVVDAGPTALPTAVPAREPLVLATPRGELALDPVAGEVLVVRGADADVYWHVLGDDIDPDALRAAGSLGAMTALAEALGAEPEVDGDEIVLRGPDAFIRASGIGAVDGLDSTQAVAFPGTEAVWRPDAPDSPHAASAVASIQDALAGSIRAWSHDGRERSGPSDLKPWIPTNRGHRLDSGTEFFDSEIGDGGALTGPAIIEVHYQMWVDDAGVVDSSLARGRPATFPFGQGRLIEGWEEGLIGMREGGTRVLVVPPEAGYGERGRPGLIGPDSLLTFEVHLLQVEPFELPVDPPPSP